jgi:hypothetical protein
MRRPSTPSLCSVSASSARRIASIAAFGWWPMRSKPKPSTLYSRAQVTSESTMSFCIIRCSAAVFWQHVEVSTAPVVGTSRW